MSPKKVKRLARFLVVVFITAILVCLVGMCFANAAEYQPATQKTQAHEIAEAARALGLSETDPIIVRAKELWNEADSQFQNDRDIIATVIYNEAWGGCTDRHRELVGAVILNRMCSNIYPATVYDVVVQPGQYLKAYATPDSVYWIKARANSEDWLHCQELATKVLNGEVTCDDDVMYQANFRQGSSVYETCYTSYSVTYFCHR